MTREEHLEWCKVRAREFLDRGEYGPAITSMMMDLKKHSDTVGLSDDALHDFFEVGTPDEARDFVEHFN